MMLISTRKTAKPRMPKAQKNTNYQKKGSTAEKPIQKTTLNLRPIAERRRMIAELEAKKANLHPLFPRVSDHPPISSIKLLKGQIIAFLAVA